MTEDEYNALDELDIFRQEAALSHAELWLRYFELGGMSTGFGLQAFLTECSHRVTMTTMSSPRPLTSASLSLAVIIPSPTRRDNRWETRNAQTHS